MKQNKQLDQLDTLSLLEAINQQDQLIALAVKECLPRIAEAVDAVHERMQCGGRLIYIGAGTSGRLGVLDASEIPPTFGADPELVRGIIAGGETALRNAVENAEDDRQQAVKDLQAIGLCKEDSLLGIAASGSTPYVLSALEYTNQCGALSLGLACRKPAALSEIARISIVVDVGPEILQGSSRLKAGTAQKMVLNMLSTSLMIRQGRVYADLMVSVQPTNKKLRKRASGLVQQICEANDEQARLALEGTDWNVKTACLMLRKGLTPNEASMELDQSNGILRKALQDG